MKLNKKYIRSSVQYIYIYECVCIPDFTEMHMYGTMESERYAKKLKT